MAAFAWLTVRQAQEALKHGRLEEALRLIQQPHALEHRGAAALTTRLARAFTMRAERFLRKDDAEAAWRDLLQAEHLHSPEKNAERLRESLTRLGVAEVRALLQAGEPGRAEEAAARLRGKLVRTSELQVVEEAARGWLTALDLAARGEFTRALEGVDRVVRLVRGLKVLEEYRKALEQRQQTFSGLLVRLHEAADAGRGADVIHAAEQVLAVAPQHPEARKVRGQAWKAVEPVTVALSESRPEPSPAQPPAPPSPPDRFLLWIDGVGGYLVCMGTRVNFGQAVPGSPVDVPLVADVSRMHATLSRDGEGYVLEAVRALQVNGKPVTRHLAAPRRPGDARPVVPVPVLAAGPAQRDGPAGSGERPPAHAGGGRRTGDGGNADSRGRAAGPRQYAGP